MPYVLTMDSIYDSFYNDGVIVTAEQLNCAYVGICEIGDVSGYETVTAQGFYTVNGKTVYGNTRIF